MKARYILFFVILVSIGFFCCRPNSFPIFVPKYTLNTFKADIIKNDSFYVFVEIPKTHISDTNYIIFVEMGICNYIDDTLSVKIKNIKACLNVKKRRRTGYSFLKSTKDEIFEGVASIDTVTANLQSRQKILFIIDFKTFNRSCINHFTDMRSLEITIPEIIINDSIFSERRAFFLCK
jgi:hypothetical protein